MNDPRPVSLASFGALAALLVTPLCGLWFSCGCEWPWGQFFMACNALLKNTPLPHCPWCVYPLAAGLSIGTAVVAGVAAAWRAPALRVGLAAGILYRSGIATAALVGLLGLGGLLTVLATAYPTFIGWRLS